MENVEATILNALIATTPTLIGKAIEWYKGKDEDADAEAKKIIKKAYDKLRNYFTDHYVKVLLALGNGIGLPIHELRGRIHPRLQLAGKAIHKFDGEFRYRLEYLRLTGVITLVAASEYRITRLGQAFLEEVRRRRDYNEVLFAH
jgi:hypothetical protein